MAGGRLGTRSRGRALRHLSRVPGAVDLASAAPGALPNNGFEYRESGVGARVRKERALVYANVGVHAVADVESLELLSAVAAEGAQLMREREENRSAAARERADRLVGAGVAR